MQVTNTQIGKVLELHLHRVYGASNTPGIRSAQGPDQLILSRKAEDVQELKNQIAALPEMRVGVVKDFKNRVQSGAYKAGGLEVAQDMITSALRNRGRV